MRLFRGPEPQVLRLGELVAGIERQGAVQVLARLPEPALAAEADRHPHQRLRVMGHELGRAAEMAAGAAAVAADDAGDELVVDAQAQLGRAVIGVELEARWNSVSTGEVEIMAMVMEVKGERMSLTCMILPMSTWTAGSLGRRSRASLAADSASARALLPAAASFLTWE